MKQIKFFSFLLICSLMIASVAMSSCSRSESASSARGAIELWDTYRVSEFATALDSIDATTEGLDNPLRVILGGMSMAEGPLVGMAFYNDTVVIDSILTAPLAKSLLPSDLRLAWTSYPTSARGSFYALLALKAHEEGPLFSAKVSEAKVAQSEWGVAVALNFESEDKERIDSLKAENPYLLCVIEGKVYPIVSPEESGNAEGNYMIPGIFDDEQAAEQLVQMIKQ